MSKRSKVFMVVPFKSSFIQGDISIIEKFHPLHLDMHNWADKKRVPLNMLAQLFSLFLRIGRTSVIVIEFGGYWSLIPAMMGKIFRVPVIILLHGTDCASLPNVPYGSLRKRLIKLSCKISYRCSSLLVPVSESLMYTNNEYCDSFKEQGIRVHFPHSTTPSEVVFNGLDSDFWKESEERSKEHNRCIAVFSDNQFKLKGGDLILSIAEQFPEHNFYIAGTKKPKHLKQIPSNVHFLGKISREELRDEYRKATFHFQLSMFEGFGLALCEAMLCGCVPIGSSVNMIPEIIGDTGFIVDKRDREILATVVQAATQKSNIEELGPRARQRIVREFSLEARENKLNAIINSIQNENQKGH